MGCIRNRRKFCTPSSCAFRVRWIASPIEGEPSGAKAMGLWLGAACKLSLGRERLGKMRAPSQTPKTTLKLFVSVPSLLQACPSIDTVC